MWEEAYIVILWNGAEDEGSDDAKITATTS
jgi:hypothetical protein